MQLTRRILTPTVTALVFVTWALVATLVFANRLPNADGDTARHLRHGETILATGAVIRADPFSFSRPGEAFVGFEYGSQIVFALSHRAAGLPGVVVLSGLLIALTWALVARFLLRRGVDPAFAYCTTMASAILGSMHWAARPHLFTQLFVVVLLDWLDRPSHDRRPPLWAFALLFLVWTNLHGGWLFGLILIGLYATPDLLGFLRHRHGAERRQAALRWGGILGASAAVTIVNPWGPALPIHVLSFFGQGLIQQQTNEFMSPDFSRLGPRLFLLALVLAVAALARSSRRLPLPHLMIVLATIAFALMAQRNIALFAITALPLLALHFDASWRRLPEPPNLRASFIQAQHQGRFWPWAAPVTGALVLLALLAGRIGNAQLLPDHFDEEVFPVAVTREARAAGVEGRLFAEFIWGGYILYAWPEQRVFIDGGTDFYGEELLRDYLEISTLQPDWRRRLARWEFDLALVPSTSRFAAQLVREPGWSLAWCDRRAALLSRRPLPLHPPQSADAVAACSLLRGDD